MKRDAQVCFQMAFVCWSAHAIYPSAHGGIGATITEFSRWKRCALEKTDLSKKGSIDEEIQNLVTFINEQEDYFTTSSCSGRVVLCSDDTLTQKDDVKIETNQKKGCTWFYVSHKVFDAEEIFNALGNVKCASKFKFEPFVLHAQCRTQENARLLLQAAVQAGFRNSGITYGKAGKKVITAIRGTACLEVPLTDENGRRLTCDAYIKYVTNTSHQKLLKNFTMIHTFEGLFRKLLADKMTPIEKLSTKEVYRRKGRTGRVKCKQTDEFDTHVLFEEDLQAG